MFKTLGSAFKNQDIRKKILITVLLLLIYRLGCYLPIPGIDYAVYSEVFTESSNSLLGLLNAVTGSALANGAFFALGVTPYINASIFNMQHFEKIIMCAGNLIPSQNMFEDQDVSDTN